MGREGEGRGGEGVERRVEEVEMEGGGERGGEGGRGGEGEGRVEGKEVGGIGREGNSKRWKRWLRHLNQNRISICMHHSFPLHSITPKST